MSAARVLQMLILSRGTKWTMAIGGIGYCVYSAAFLCYNHTQNEGFVIFSGALLGFCAAFLWCAQGVVMMVSPDAMLDTFYFHMNIRNSLTHAAINSSRIPLNRNGAVQSPSLGSCST